MGTPWQGKRLFVGGIADGCFLNVGGLRRMTVQIDGQCEDYTRWDFVGTDLECYAVDGWDAATVRSEITRCTSNLLNSMEAV